ncbi:MAG: hypothetical protein KatS3mg094_413 [Candidatus Parcubacteria bacterium]|nr:MAG: hypothetical protein KatS3mg094_413 [Candidatus Parcubacteria bacterium]
MNSLKEKLEQLVRGEVRDDNLEEFSYDKSIFKIKPQIVVFPYNEDDIKKLIIFTKENNLYLTCRSAGTDMSGGALTDSIMIVFTKYMNKILEINHQEKYVILQPGVYFRDLEKELDKYNLMLPSYPASKELCALGGMVANNSGGERTIKYGKTENYVLGLNVILADGNEYYFEKVSGEELKHKLSLNNFEGEIYRKIYNLIKNNIDLINKNKPQVNKNSAGYNIWSVYSINENGEEYLDLTKLFVGSQGTLGIITKIKLRLVDKLQNNKLAVIFLKSVNQINEILDYLLRSDPVSIEITDDHTFKIFLRFYREMAELLGFKGLISNLKLFLPEIKLILLNGIPKLIVLVEFESNDLKEIDDKISNLVRFLKNKNINFILCKNDTEKEKYWKIRRDTYKLLREKIKDRIASPFIDDIIINPHNFYDFLPKLVSILDKYNFIYTISGHLGDGNLHIIPLLDFKKEKDKILPAMEEVYDLTIKYKGSITAEHNDGLIRGWYLKKMFGEEIFEIFSEIKKIFDPDKIFNRYKKIDADKDYSFSHLIT